MTTGPADDGALWGQDVVFRLERGYRRPLLTRGSAALAAAVLAAVVAGLGVLPDVAWGVAAASGALALSYAARYVWVGRFRTRLSPRGIEMRGYLDHFVPWSDVTGVEVTAAEATGLILSGGTGPRGGGMRVTEFDPSGQHQLPGQLLGQGGSASGFRGRLATVRVARSRGSPLLLRAPAVTSWQDDPGFEDKVATIRRWWRRHAQGMPG
jgi:hypothetical protein